ncbi:hypothetical protein L1887_28211 [Cichorium endivia]|nr:hypothetical protein L1887_28211 [Cichorium endivia]
MAGDTPGMIPGSNPSFDAVNPQHDQVIVFSAQSLEDSDISKKQSDYPYSFKVAENLQEKKNQYCSRDYKGSMFKNYSGSLIEATDVRRSKEKSITLHQKRFPSMPSDGPMLEEGNVISTMEAVDAATTGLGPADGGDKVLDGACQPIRRSDLVEGMVVDGDSSDTSSDGCNGEVDGNRRTEICDDLKIYLRSAPLVDGGGGSEFSLDHADGGEKAQTVDGSNDGTFSSDIGDNPQTVDSACTFDGLGKAGSSLLPPCPNLSSLRNIHSANCEPLINAVNVDIGTFSPPTSIELPFPKGQTLKCVLNQGGYETFFAENESDCTNHFPDFVNSSPCAFNAPASLSPLDAPPSSRPPFPSILGPRPISSNSLLGPLPKPVKNKDMSMPSAHVSCSSLLHVEKTNNPPVMHSNPQPPVNINNKIPPNVNPNVQNEVVSNSDPSKININAWSRKLPLLVNSHANIITGPQKHSSANFRYIPNLSNDVNVP